MNEIPVFNPAELITVAGEQLATTSLKVSKAFGKRHGDVLRAVDNVECSEEFSQRNFASRDFVDGRGRRRRYVEMTRDGFIFLVMGFTGRFAAAIKEGYINAFNAMAEMMRNQAASAWGKYNHAYLEFRHEQEHVSRCGRAMRLWQDHKPEHIQRLELLHPQLPLLLN